MYCNCHIRDKGVIEAIAKKLGKFIISPNVTMTTTHVVCGAPRRTWNALAGSMCGCWIVRPEWVSVCGCWIVRPEWVSVCGCCIVRPE